MLTLKLLSYVLAIPNDAYTTLGKNLSWSLINQSRVLQADWLILDNDEKATLNTNMPYWHFSCYLQIML